MAEEQAERLEWLRDRKGYKTLADAGRAYGIDYSLYKKLADGSRALTRETAEKIARHHRISAGWLMFGEGTPSGEVSIPLVGRIENGRELEIDGEQVNAVLAQINAVAVEVADESLYPLAQANDVIFLGPARRDIDRMIGRECAIHLEDGRRMFGVLERGQRAGIYDLHGFNVKTQRDLRVHTVREFLGVRRRARANHPRRVRPLKRTPDESIPAS
jgi:hypothetical protein